MSASRPNRISVALCTYNGARYLGQQLESILAQTRLPGEVILCDDGSSDSTVAIAKDFAARAPFKVDVIQNERNLGSTRNFERAIALCTGDLIALSDQDDIWHPSRLARSEEEFEKHPEAGLVFSDADLIDHSGQRLDGTLWKTFKFSDAVQRRLIGGEYTLCLRLRFVTGATAMFRSTLRDRILPVGEGWIHDEWIAASVPLFAEIRPIPERLIQYRKHAEQQLGPAPPVSMVHRVRDVDLVNESLHWKRIDRVNRMMQSLCAKFSGAPLDESGRRRFGEYRRYAEHVSFRHHLPTNRLARVKPILAHFRDYLTFDNVGRMMKDLLSHS